LLEGGLRYEPAGSLDLYSGYVEPEHVEILIGQPLGRRNAGAASEIQDLGARRKQLC
jgi:hypothetical protein